MCLFSKKKQNNSETTDVEKPEKEKSDVEKPEEIDVSEMRCVYAPPEYFRRMEKQAKRKEKAKNNRDYPENHGDEDEI